MSETDLQEAFRQLALDLDAVSEDDPDLRDFTIQRAGKEVHVEFRAYKAWLEIRVSDPERKKRPMATLTGVGPLDKLGRKMGVDEKLDLDESFLEHFDIETEAPPEAILAMFGSRAVHDACTALEKLDALPVWIGDASVGIARGAGVKDLSADKISKIVEALAAFENALGTWDEKADRTPLRGKGGRRIIRKTPRESSIGWALDWSPLAAIFVTIFMAIVWSALPGYAMGSHTSVLFAIAGAISIATLVISLRVLVGQKSAFARAIARTIGVTVIASHILFFLLHMYNRGGGTSHVETVRIVGRTPPKGKSSGTTDFVRNGSSEVYRIASGWGTDKGATLRITVHEGRLGWLWCEY